jgi:hypothetical protein
MMIRTAWHFEDSHEKAISNPLICPERRIRDGQEADLDTIPRMVENMAHAPKRSNGPVNSL